MLRLRSPTCAQHVVLSLLIGFVMQRPHEMRMIGLSRTDYQLIGEIAVLSGMLEDAMKVCIVRMVQGPWPDGIALVAHLNFQSLCDIAKSLLPACVHDDGLKYGFKGVFGDLRSTYEERNNLLHGPFSPVAASIGAKKAIFRHTARGAVKVKSLQLETSSLRQLLERLIRLHDELFGLELLLEEERSQRAPEYDIPQRPAGIPPAKYEPPCKKPLKASQ